MSNMPHKVSDDFFERLEQDSKFMRYQQRVSKFKYRLRKKGLFPIIKNDYLYIYSVKSTDASKELVDECRKTLFDVYNVVTNNQKYINDFRFRSSSFPEFRNILKHRVSTKEDLYDYYHLDNDIEKDKFMRLPQNKMYIIDDKMSFDGVVDEIVKYYMTFVFKRPSKIAEIVSFLSGYFDADFAAAKAYRFLYLKDRDFSIGINPIEDKQFEIDRMDYSNKEDNLSYDEKLELIKRIISSFDIECLYSSRIDEMSDFILESIFKTKSRKLILGCGSDNYNLLYNSAFSDIYKKIFPVNEFKSSDVKKYVK